MSSILIFLGHVSYLKNSNAAMDVCNFLFSTKSKLFYCNFLGKLEQTQSWEREGYTISLGLTKQSPVLADFLSSEP
jgi:hypothetical protein